MTEKGQLAMSVDAISGHCTECDKYRHCVSLLLCQMILKCDLLMNLTNALAFAWEHKR